MKKSDDSNQSNSNRVDNDNNKSDDTCKDTKSKEKKIFKKEEPKKKKEELDIIKIRNKEEKRQMEAHLKQYSGDNKEGHDYRRKNKKNKQENEVVLKY